MAIFASPDNALALLRRGFLPLFFAEMMDMKGTNEPEYSVAEEIANSVSHGLGALAAIGGLVWFMTQLPAGSATVTWSSVLVYGISAILLYFASTLYHAVTHINLKKILRAIDHMAILLFIAGTYTPFALLCIGGSAGWWMFGIIWGLAALGVVFKLSPWRDNEWVSVPLYLGMGWLCVSQFGQLQAALSTAELALLAGGGLAYTLGVIFYLVDRLPFNHAIWHLFVLAGSTLQYLSLYLFVLVP